MSNSPEPATVVPDKIDIVDLSDAIKRLMLRYSDAVEACGSVSTLSLLPLVKLYFHFAMWVFATELCILTVPIDLIFLLLRKIFGRPRLVLGRALYAYVTAPFRSVWGGEIPLFMIIHLRYLTRLLLFYRSQSLINTLHRVYNRQHLDLLTANPPNSEALGEAEKFQKAFELFRKITRDSYQLGALAVGGPLVALLSVSVQKALLPIFTWIWNFFGGPSLSLSSEEIGTLGGFFILFAWCTLWILVSAWMDMRSILTGLGVQEAEHNAYLSARIKFSREIPYDLLLYFSFVALLGWSFYYSLTNISEQLQNSELFQPEQSTLLRYNAMQFGIIFSLLLCFGLVALARRHHISNLAFSAAGAKKS